MPATSGACDTPMPSRKRPGYASASVFCAAAIAIASRAHTFAIPVATISRSVAPSSSPACVNTSRPSASGIQSTLKPSCSISRAAAQAVAAGRTSRKCQRPTRPRSMVAYSLQPTRIDAVVVGDAALSRVQAAPRSAEEGETGVRTQIGTERRRELAALRLEVVDAEILAVLAVGAADAEDLDDGVHARAWNAHPARLETVPLAAIVVAEAAGISRRNAAARRRGEVTRSAAAILIRLTGLAARGAEAPDHPAADRIRADGGDAVVVYGRLDGGFIPTA